MWALSSCSCYYHIDVIVGRWVSRHALVMIVLLFLAHWRFHSITYTWSALSEQTPQHLTSAGPVMPLLDKFRPGST